MGSIPHNDYLSSLLVEVRIMLVRGERLNGIQEVCGSIPHISTKKEVSERISLFCILILRIFPEKVRMDKEKQG